MRVRECSFDPDLLDLMAHENGQPLEDSVMPEEAELPFSVRKTIIADMARKGISLLDIMRDVLTERQALVVTLSLEMGYSLTQIMAILGLKSHKDITQILESSVKKIQNRIGVFSHLLSIS